jgi:hypothetical protein
MSPHKLVRFKMAVALLRSHDSAHDFAIAQLTFKCTRTLSHVQGDGMQILLSRRNAYAGV